MPLLENELQRLDAQRDFSGGMKMIGPLLPDEYRYAENIIIRDGFPETRPGMRRLFRALQEGFQEVFSFDGFWFPFTFVGSVWGTIQGIGFFRFLDDPATRTIIVSDQRVYVDSGGFVTEVATSEIIGSDEEIKFVQAKQFVFMLRGDTSNILYWDGAEGGFTTVPDTIVAGNTNIPMSGNGDFIAGRLALVVNRDEVWFSDPLEFTEWHNINQAFGISSGDGDEIIALREYHDQFTIIWKKRSTYALRGANQPQIQATQFSELVAISNVFTENTKVGCVASESIIEYGERLAWLSFRGFMALHRNAQNEVLGITLPLSWPIQPIIDRINWPAASKCAGVAFENYLIWAIPVDGSTVNNMLVVYDLLAQKGRGAWISVWTSEMFRVKQFVKVDEDLYFLGEDGILRNMWSDDPWDTEDPLNDTQIYDDVKIYQKDEHAFFQTSGEDKIFKALQLTQGNDPNDSTNWAQETDIYNLFQVKTEFWSTWLYGGDRANPKRRGKTQVYISHQDPKVTVSVEADDHNTLSDVIVDREYPQQEYDTDFRTNWDSSNEGLDFSVPNRKDYTVFLGGFPVPSFDFVQVVGGSVVSFVPMGGGKVMALDDSAFADVHISVNDGEGWTKVFDAATPFPVAKAAYMGSNQVVAVKRGGTDVAVTSDDGSTWTTHSPTINGFWKGVMSDGAGNVWGGTTTGYIYKSTDSGVTWAELTTVTLTGTLQSLSYASSSVVFIGDDAGNIYKTTDTFASLSSVNIPNVTNVEAVSSVGDNVFIAFCLNGTDKQWIYRSANAGLTWSAWGTPTGVLSLTSGALSGNTMMYGEALRIYSSKDSIAFDDDNEIDLDLWEHHNLRFLRHLSSRYSVRIKSTRGKLRINAIESVFEPTRFAARAR